MHTYSQDITGNTYGRWTVIAYSHSRGNGQTVYKCRCECGTEKDVLRRSLVNGMSTSCGCYHKDAVTKHKSRNKKLYSIWHNMKDRCYREKHPMSHYYSSRGLGVCAEWIHDYSAFHIWAYNNGYKEGLSIHRINNDLGYSPENCMWATDLEQMQNRRDTLLLTYNDETKTMFEWSKLVGIPYHTVRQRVRRGWSVHDALTLQPDRTQRVMSLSKNGD